jgi:hypothetical protein
MSEKTEKEARKPTRKVLTMTPLSTKHYLCSSTTPGDMRSAHAILFGHMVERAEGVVRHYRSDLYHDALWLDRHFTAAPFSFYWGARDRNVHRHRPRTCGLLEQEGVARLNRD